MVFISLAGIGFVKAFHVRYAVSYSVFWILMVNISKGSKGCIIRFDDTKNTY